jgi:hypothetical protein
MCASLTCADGCRSVVDVDLVAEFVPLCPQLSRMSILYIHAVSRRFRCYRSQFLNLLSLSPSVCFSMAAKAKVESIVSLLV